MKKLMIAALAAMTIGTASYAITAEEAIESKNWYTIKEYCKTNNLEIYSFLFESNKLEFSAIKSIYTSIQYVPRASYASLTDKVAQYYSVEQANEIFNYENTEASTWMSMVDRRTKSMSADSIANKYGRTGHHKFIADTVFEKHLIPTYTNKIKVAEVAIKLDSNLKVTKYRDLFYEYSKSCPSAQLDLAISYNDVDKIIDALLAMDSSITAKQVEAIIEPINAVALDYRKTEILKVLNNINGWCTIKLYDDQSTWEPLLAKIRAMISVRK